MRRLKQRALRASFERFLETEWRSGSARDRALQAYVSEQAWWLEDYSLFRALHAREHERPWMEWPEALQRREPPAIDRARRELADDVLFQQYLQWLAGTQWQHARAHAHGVALFGDLPFMVDGDSADVWVRQHQFRLDMSVGAPPDAFSATGQDWGMPVYQWSALAAEDYRWLRERARRSADLFDGYRVDHLVGFYRTCRLKEACRVKRRRRVAGRRLHAARRAVAARARRDPPRAVPRRRRGDHRRGSRHRPRFRARVARAAWHPGLPRVPLGALLARRRAAVPRSVGVPAAVGGRVRHARHRAGRRVVGALRRKASDPQVSELPSVQRLTGGADLTHRPFDATVRDILLEVLFASASELLLPVQDAFGWRDRINEPATVSDDNWTYRLPWLVDTLDDVPEAAREAKNSCGRGRNGHGRR